MKPSAKRVSSQASAAGVASQIAKYMMKKPKFWSDIMVMWKTILGLSAGAERTPMTRVVSELGVGFDERRQSSEI